MDTYRLNVARLTLREEIGLLPHGLRGVFSRRFGAAERFPLLLLPAPAPLTRAEAIAEPPPRLAPLVGQARQVGFRDPLAFETNHPLALAPHSMVLMRHASGNALLRLADAHRPDGTLAATLITPLADRRVVLTTTDRRASALLPPGVLAFVCPGTPLGALWERHKSHVAGDEMAAPMPLADADEMLEFCNTLEERLFHWRDTDRSLLIPLSDGETALLRDEVARGRREQRRLRRGGLESALAFASLQAAFAPSSLPWRHAPDEPLTPAALASMSPLARATHRPLRQGGIFDAMLAAATLLLLFGLARRELWSAPELWLALGATILLHGLGHALGWRYAREAVPEPHRPVLRHLRVIPHKVAGNDPAWGRARAILLGPLPGLIAGCLLLTLAFFAPLPNWLQLWGGVLLGVNLLTLLPLPFLDGGRLLRLLLYGRFPWLAPAVRLGVAALLAAMAVLTGSLVPGTLAVLLAATLPIHCRLAAVGRQALHYIRKTERRLARTGSPAVLSLPFAAPVMAVVARVRERLPHLATPERISRTAHHLCETALLRPRSSKMPMAALAIYGFALALPLLPACCGLFKARPMAELALIGAYPHAAEPPNTSARGMAIYIGMEEEAAVETANGTRTPFPDDNRRPHDAPYPPPVGEKRDEKSQQKPPRGPRFDPGSETREPIIENFRWR